MKTELYLWFIRKSNFLLTSLIVFLGFGAVTSCDKEGNETPVEYGTPNAMYSIKGKVIDSENKAIPSISLFILDKQKYDIYFEGSIKTNTAGEFNTTFSAFPTNEFFIVAKDTDADLNGSFEADTSKITFNKEDYYEEGKGAWYEGAAKKEITIVLKEKTNE